MPTTDAIGEQVIEAVVAGPEGANRLFTISGAANVCIEATRQQVPPRHGLSWWDHLLRACSFIGRSAQLQ